MVLIDHTHTNKRKVTEPVSSTSCDKDTIESGEERGIQEDRREKKGEKEELKILLTVNSSLDFSLSWVDQHGQLG